jgi:hypothetical protein
MANPSMDRDGVSWMRQQLQEAHPDLLRQMLTSMVQELMGAEAKELCGAEYGEHSSERSNSATLTGSESGTPEPAPSPWRSPSFARAATFQTGCWSLGAGPSGRW